MATPDERIIRRLREENDELRERVRQLEERGRARCSLPSDWPISAAVRAYLIALSSGRVVSRAGLLAASEPHGRGRLERDPSPRTIDAHFSRCRRVLADLGIRVSALWGVGYYLEGESLRIVRDALVREAGDGFSE